VSGKNGNNPSGVVPAVIVHISLGAKPVPVTVTSVPGRVPVGGEPNEGVTDVIAAACTLGVTTDETAMNTPDMRSNNTKNEEPTLAVIN
jgi:hypothetical protein